MLIAPRVDSYLQSVLRGDRRLALEIVDAALAGGLAIDVIQEDIVRESQRRIGALWERNVISVAEEHMATAITRQVLTHLHEGAIPAVGKDERVLVACGEGGPSPIRADPVLFRQALVNLVDNAVKYTPAGGQVEVSATLVNGTVQVAVTDTGPGIAPEHQPRIFERFYRVDPARSSSAQAGTGLGLAIVKWSVEACGGSVAVGSRNEHGSTFTLTFPASPAIGTGAGTENYPRAPYSGASS